MTEGRERFQDHFSAQAAEYARFRPVYPAALYEWLAASAPGRALAWDCGTGSGQAATALAGYFEHVVASDPSADQIRHAQPHPRVRYFIGSAEEPPAEAQGADLVTTAQALHWFDHARFWAALGRVLRPGGLYVAWGYGLMRITTAVDAIVDDYYTNVVGAYWPPDRRHIESGYRTIAFPLTEVVAPPFTMTAQWSLAALLGYLDTWSATRRCLAAQGDHPLAQVRTHLEESWGNADVRPVEWPLFVRAGRFP